jgi:acetyl-CoA acetyltransferase
LRDRIAIVGVGETEYTKRGGIGRSEFQLACEAIHSAVSDAGVELADVDGMVTYSSDRNEPAHVAQVLGIPHLRYAGLFPGGGNAACGIVHNAAMAVFSGTADMVVCYRALAQGQFERLGQALVQDPLARGFLAFTVPFGIASAAQLYALQARRHMHEFGTTSRQFGRIAVASYRHAQFNPRAIMRGRPLTIEEHQNSRMIADPYRLYDCCLESDGACALVVASVERAMDLPHPPVYIKSAAQGNDARDGLDYHARSDKTWVSGGFIDLSRDLYSRAGVGPKDIDVAQIYENFTGQVLMGIEDFGFCERGEGGSYVETGALEWPHGTVPMNTSGGNLAEGYIHGLEMVIEGARQIQGTSTCQVEGAEICLVAAAPSAPPNSALILGVRD